MNVVEIMCCMVLVMWCCVEILGFVVLFDVFICIVIDVFNVLGLFVNYWVNVWVNVFFVIGLIVEGNMDWVVMLL